MSFSLVYKRGNTCLKTKFLVPRILKMAGTGFKPKTIYLDVWCVKMLTPPFGIFCLTLYSLATSVVSCYKGTFM